MPPPNVFALQSSELNAFLFANVGTELNGSPLTILSVLARLGQDPWAEAASWAKLPRAAAIDCLAQSLARMPLSQQALTESRATATRLASLLPGPATPFAPRAGGSSMGEQIPRWVLATLLAFALTWGLTYVFVVQPHLAKATYAPPQTTAPLP